MSDLKPCPFCGNKPTLRYDSGNEVWGQSWQVACVCGVSFPKVYGSSSWASNKKQDKAAIQAATSPWNLRA